MHSLVFMQADLNGDGRISAAEYASYLAHLDLAAQSSLGNDSPATGVLGGGGSVPAGGASASIHVGLRVPAHP